APLAAFSSVAPSSRSAPYQSYEGSTIGVQPLRLRWCAVFCLRRRYYGVVCADRQKASDMPRRRTKLGYASWRHWRECVIQIRSKTTARACRLTVVMNSAAYKPLSDEERARLIELGRRQLPELDRRAEKAMENLRRIAQGLPRKH